MFQNKEIKWFGISLLAITALLAAAGFMISPTAGILAVISAALFCTAFFIFTKIRYDKIRQISEQVDRVLHNEDRLYISESTEGELSILESEISKMTLRIREQNNALKREKERLADSLADVAHQLRTPLTSASLTLSLLKTTADERERKTLLREAEEFFVKMDWLITALLKLSRLDADVVVFQTESVKVKDLVRSALLPFQILMELHDITVQLDVPDTAVVQGDARWLSEALQNIVKNCIESAGENGTLWIACAENVLYTEITVHDNGTGFDKEDIPCLFNRFYRGKNTSSAGYGIGLSLSKTIIVRQNGTVSAKNHPKGGALFTIRFPK